MSSEQNREQTEGQSEFDSQCLVFAGSKEEDVDFAKVFWNSVSLHPPWESRLVSGDIRQRLKVANSSQQRKEPFLLEAYIKEKTEEKLGYLEKARKREDIMELLRKQRAERIKKELLSRPYQPKYTPKVQSSTAADSSEEAWETLRSLRDFN
ncbi:cilia- and flagella-associated protein HOATZ-like isoform X2 [Acipenser ruthenus]|uniref:cilia- and flagella-associated protein HOATZ-like isoform X2 n=1 Tax=Acipenser ruthenus TaxID=7906 RepID=UPI00155FCF53|nr:cilia- and flagella-associated protein HOATZ-like isoform X2 [Acipenser ruthenus]